MKSITPRFFSSLAGKELLTAFSVAFVFIAFSTSFFVPTAQAISESFVSVTANGASGSLTLTANEPFTVDWVSANASNCNLLLDGEILSGVERTGSVGPLDASHPFYPAVNAPKTFTITCDGIGGVVSQSVIVSRASGQTPTPGASVTGLHTSGSQILNSSGQAVRLVGVDYGMTHPCIQGWGLYTSDSAPNDAFVKAMKTWNITSVRVQLNEDCWLGINGAAAAYSGVNYQNAVKNLVSLLTQNNIAAILDLHWNAPGTVKAESQQPMPDRDHAPAFWTSVASTFKDNTAVVFDLYNEPYPDNNQDTTAAWTCLRDGCAQTYYVDANGNNVAKTWQAAGMQELVTAVRNTGSKNLIITEGVGWGGLMTQWLNYMPQDPAGNLAASTHIYNQTWCSTQSCWDGVLAPIIARVPLVVGELGDSAAGCNRSSFNDSLMNWLDAKGQHYNAWYWWTDAQVGCGNFALLKDYGQTNGSPTPTAYGQLFKDRFTAVAGGGGVTPTPAPVPTPVSAPSVSISASPASGNANSISPTLSWSSTNSATSCTASGDWSGGKSTSGSQSMGMLSTAKTYNYGLSCANAQGSGSSNTSVTVSAIVTPPPPTPTPSPTNQTWTYCSGTGSSCDYSGLRDVRLTGPSGVVSQVEKYAAIPCAAYGFQNAGATVSAGNYDHCEYGDMKTQVITNPVPGIAGSPATWVVPRGDTVGSGLALLRPGSAGIFVGEGSFRTTCNLVGYGMYDPIVFPGQTNVGHLHMFFGNVGVSPNSTTASITTSGNSTCRGGILNRTAYWFPSVFNAQTGKVITPGFGQFYYKTGYNADYHKTKTIPVGLRIIAGNKNSTSGQDGGPNYAVMWLCRDGSTSSVNGAMANCRPGDELQMWVAFPQCWDGVNLDSADHQSHMAYFNYRNPPEVSTCPADHPYQIPAITEILKLPVEAGENVANWRLSSDTYSNSMPGGFSAHADWLSGWDPATMNTLVTQCLNAGKDCGVGSIGDGNDLYYDVY